MTNLNTCTEWAPFCWIEAHPGLAGWLQATGALVLVGLTLWSVRDARQASDHQFAEARAREARERRDAELRRAQESAARSAAALSIARVTVHGLKKTLDWIDEHPQLPQSEHRVFVEKVTDAMEKDLDALPVHELADLQAINHVVSIRYQVRAFRTAFGLVVADDLYDMKLAKAATYGANKALQGLQDRCEELQSVDPDIAALRTEL